MKEICVWFQFINLKQIFLLKILKTLKRQSIARLWPPTMVLGVPNPSSLSGAAWAGEGVPAPAASAALDFSEFISVFLTLWRQKPLTYKVRC